MFRQSKDKAPAEDDPVPVAVAVAVEITVEVQNWFEVEEKAWNLTSKAKRLKEHKARFDAFGLRNSQPNQNAKKSFSIS